MNPKFRKCLSNKLSWLKNHYGELAKAYFIKNHKCEKCNEDRIAALAIHHPQGKKVNVFQTLCHTCHAIIHSCEARFEDIVQENWKPRQSPGQLLCGTKTKYDKGCRCDDCKLAKRISRKKNMASNAKSQAPGLSHQS